MINLMPPHDRYVETHFGGGAVMRNKRPASTNIGIDIDPAALEKWPRDSAVNITLIHGDALKTLASLSLGPGDLIYVDPPYFPETRRRKRVYRFDYTPDEHASLLQFLMRVRCMALVSGYRCNLYDTYLKDWNRRDFLAWTHTGFRTESIWYNYPTPSVLHDSRFLGGNYRERQNVKRRTERIRSRLSRLPLIERMEILSWLESQLRKAAVHAEQGQAGSNNGGHC